MSAKADPDMQMAARILLAVEGHRSRGNISPTKRQIQQSIHRIHFNREIFEKMLDTMVRAEVLVLVAERNAQGRAVERYSIAE